MSPEQKLYNDISAALQLSATESIDLVFTFPCTVTHYQIRKTWTEADIIAHFGRQEEPNRISEVMDKYVNKGPTKMWFSTSISTEATSEELRYEFMRSIDDYTTTDFENAIKNEKATANPRESVIKVLNKGLRMKQLGAEHI